MKIGSSFSSHIKHRFGLTHNNTLLGFEVGMALNTATIFILPTLAANLYTLGALPDVSTAYHMVMVVSIALALFAAANLTLCVASKENFREESILSEAIKKEYKEDVADNKLRKYFIPVIFASCIASMPFMVAGKEFLVDFWLSRTYIDSPWLTALGALLVAGTVFFDLAEIGLYAVPEERVCTRT